MVPCAFNRVLLQSLGDCGRSTSGSRNVVFSLERERAPGVTGYVVYISIQPGGSQATAIRRRKRDVV
jgi:hypothetical protein